MELLAYRSLYLEISSNQHFVKSISILSKISYIQYPSTSTLALPNKQKDKKMRCWICAKKYGIQNTKQYDQILMVILHIQLLHPDTVQTYEIGSDTLVIRPYSQKIVSQSPKFMQTISSGQHQKKSYFLSNKFSLRVKQITTNLVSKLQKSLTKRQQTYYHSTDIFRRIEEEQMEEDSEEELGEIERELQKLRIQDFTDVNENDKKFFIEWNNFIYDSRKKLSIIFKHDIPKLFVEFAKTARQKKIPRINFVMHAWTLWSVGVITDNDITKGLAEYDSMQALEGL